MVGNNWYGLGEIRMRMVDEGGFAEHRSFDRHGFDLSAPARVLLGAEQRIGVQVRPFLVEACRKVNLGVWVELGRDAGVHVVKEARRDDVRDVPKRVDLVPFKRPRRGRARAHRRFHSRR